MFHCIINAALCEQDSECCGLKAQHMDAKHGDPVALHSHDHTTAGIPDYHPPSTNAYRIEHHISITFTTVTDF